jgi:molybdopterin synthase catalytic subunit
MMAMSSHCFRPWLEADVHTDVTRDVIDPQSVLERVGSPADGAVLLFLGTVREQNDGRPVSGMRYDAFVEMAELVLARSRRRRRHARGTDRIAVVHRVGELAVGESVWPSP